jgi:hypothetical protein
VNFATFVYIWMLMGFAAILFRPKMIWQEPCKPYRVALMVLVLPSMLLVCAWSALRHQWEVSKAIVEGVDYTQGIT